MKEAKKGPVEKSRIFLHIEMDEKNQIQTSMAGDTLVLLGLCEVARDNVKVKMGIQSSKNVAADEVPGD